MSVLKNKSFQDGKYKFKDVWLQVPDYKPWLSKVDTDHAYCKVCKRSLNINYKSYHALNSHIQTNKHKRNMAKESVGFQPSFSGGSTYAVSQAVNGMNSTSQLPAKHRKISNTPDRRIAGETTSITRERDHVISKNVQSPAINIIAKQEAGNQCPLPASRQQAPSFRISTSVPCQQASEVVTHDQKFKQLPTKPHETTISIFTPDQCIAGENTNITCQRNNIAERVQLPSITIMEQDAGNECPLPVSHQQWPSFNISSNNQQITRDDIISSTSYQQAGGATAPDDWISQSISACRAMTPDQFNSAATSSTCQQESRMDFETLMLDQSNYLDDVIRCLIIFMCKDISFEPNSNSIINGCIKSKTTNDFSCDVTTLKQVCLRLAEYFLENMLKNLKYCALDVKESLNKSGECELMNVYIRFWDNSDKKVHMRYYTSFTNIVGTHNNMMQKFHKNLHSKGIILLKKSVKNPEGIPASIYSCIQAGFDLGENHCSWYSETLNKLLICLHNLFEESPKTKEHFLQISKNKKLPLPFFASLFSKKIAVERALKIWDDIKNFVQNEFSLSTSMFYPILKETCEDVVTPVKFQFFVHLTNIVQSFADIYEKNSPIFGYSVQKFVEKCLKQLNIKLDCNNNLDKIKALLHSDITANSTSADIYLGSETETMIQNLINDGKINEEQVLNLKKEARDFVFKVFNGFLEGCAYQPLIVWSLPCINPSYMIYNKADCIKKMRDMLGQFSLANPNTIKYERVLYDYKHFLDHVDITTNLNELENTDIIDLEEFFRRSLDKPGYRFIWGFVKMILILFTNVVVKDINVLDNESELIEINDNSPLNERMSCYRARKIILDHIEKGDQNRYFFCDDVRQLVLEIITKYNDEANREEGGLHAEKGSILN